MEDIEYDISPPLYLASGKSETKSSHKSPLPSAKAKKKFPLKKTSDLKKYPELKKDEFFEEIPGLPDQYDGEDIDFQILQDMTRQEADKLLSNPINQAGAFLIRQIVNIGGKNVYALVVKSDTGSITNYRIQQDGHGYTIGSSTFFSLSELVNHFKADAGGLKCKLTHYCYTENKENDASSSIPMEIRAMDQRSIELFNKSLEEGRYKCNVIRVMVVGHYGVGKTTLTKKLLGLKFDMSQNESTDGLEIYVGRCNVETDSHTWNTGEENQDKGTDLAELLRKHGVIDDMIKRVKKVDKDVQEDSSKPEQTIGIVDDSEKQLAVDYFSSEEMDETLSPRKELKTPKSLNLLKEILQKKEDEPEKRFSIEVWDFGGQGCFYCTHQSFLSYRSVYLLVFDISKDLDDFVNDEDLDPSERKKSTVREFLSFWINSIKTYAGGVVRGCPKIIIVGTHLYKIEKSKRLQKVGEYLTAICDTYAEDIASGQLILDNKLVFGFNNYGIEILQNAIIKVAKGQPFWGEELPKAWIPFQHRISVLRQEGKKIISCKEIKDFNLTLPVPLDLENIDLCLRFLHSVGSIIFYSQKALSAYVILEPKWLVTTLRSLITCESFCAQEKVRRGACRILQQMGLISMERIEAIWKLPEFSEIISVKDHMLAIMERLDLIAKPKIYQNGSIVTTDTFFIPAMAKNSPSPKWLTSIMSSNRVQTCTMDFSTSFLSPAVFYRLISSCICIWPVHQDKLYFGCCQLRLDPQHRMLILKRGDRICLVFEHRRTAVAINKNLVRGVMDVVVDILHNIINIYPGRKDSPFFTISGNFNEEVVQPTHTEGCATFCIGKAGRNDILCNSPSDLELMRFAKSWFGAKDNLVLIAVELGVDMGEFEQIEHDHRDNLVLKTFYILERWSRRRGKSSSFKELLEASQCDVHTICKIMREDDARVHQTIPTSRLEEQCTDEMIDKISVLIGRDFIHFGLELGLHQEDIEEIRNSKDTRGLFDMNRRIMLVTRDHRPGGTSLSIRSLSCALLRIGHVKAFEYFEDQFITEHDDDVQDDW